MSALPGPPGPPTRSNSATVAAEEEKFGTAGPLPRGTVNNASTVSGHASALPSGATTPQAASRRASENFNANAAAANANAWSKELNAEKAAANANAWSKELNAEKEAKDAFILIATEYRDNPGISLSTPEILDPLMASGNNRIVDLMGSPLVKTMIQVCISTVTNPKSLAPVIRYFETAFEENCELCGFELNDTIRRNVQLLIAFSKPRTPPTLKSRRRRRYPLRSRYSLRRTKQRGGTRWGAGDRMCFILYALLSILLGLLAAHTGTFLMKRAEGAAREVGAFAVGMPVAVAGGVHSSGLEALTNLYESTSEGLIMWGSIAGFYDSETYIPNQVVTLIKEKLPAFTRLGETPEYKNARREQLVRDGIARQYQETTDALANGILFLKTDPRYSARTEQVIRMIQGTVLPSLEAAANNRTMLCGSVEETVRKLSDVKEPDGSLTGESMIIGNWYNNNCTGVFNLTFSEIIEAMPLNASEFTSDEIIRVTTVAQQLHNNTKRDVAFSNMTEIVAESVRLYEGGSARPNELTRAAVSFLFESVLNISGFPLLSQFVEPELRSALFGSGTATTSAVVSAEGSAQLGMTTRASGTIKYFALPFDESAPLVAPPILEAPPLTIDETKQRLSFEPLYAVIDAEVRVPPELKGFMRALFENRVLQHELEMRELVVAAAIARSQERMKDLTFKLYGDLTAGVREFMRANPSSDPERDDKLITAAQPYIDLFKSLRIVPPPGFEADLITYATIASAGGHAKTRVNALIAELAPNVRTLEEYKPPGEAAAEAPSIGIFNAISGFVASIPGCVDFITSILTGEIQGGYSNVGEFVGVLVTLVGLVQSYRTVDKNASNRGVSDQLQAAIQALAGTLQVLRNGTVAPAATGVPALTNAPSAAAAATGGPAITNAPRGATAAAAGGGGNVPRPSRWGPPLLLPPPGGGSSSLPPRSARASSTTGKKTRPPFTRLEGESNIAFLKRLVAHNKKAADPYPDTYGIAVVRGMMLTDSDMIALDYDVTDVNDRRVLMRWFTGAGVDSQARAAGFTRRRTRKQKNRRT